MDSKTSLVIIRDKSCLSAHKHNDDSNNNNIDLFWYHILRSLMLDFDMKISTVLHFLTTLDSSFKLSNQDVVIVKLGFHGTEKHQ